MSEERDFEEYTSELVGEIDPVLFAADGELLDGFHRSEQGWEKKAVLEWCKTDRQKWAVKIQRNVKRRDVSGDETDHYIVSLALAILDEEGEDVFRDLVKLTARDAGLTQPRVRTAFSRKKSMLPNMFTLKPEVSKRKKREADDEIKPAFTEKPKKGSAEFNYAVDDTIKKMFGMPESAMMQRLIAIHDLTKEEALDSLLSHKNQYPNLWKVREEASKPKTEARFEEKERGRPSTPEPRVVSNPPLEGPTSYSADPNLGVAYSWYPDDVLDEVWNLLPKPSEKLQFIRTLFQTCWLIAKEDYSTKDLLMITQERM